MALHLSSTTSIYMYRTWLPPADVNIELSETFEDPHSAWSDIPESYFVPGSKESVLGEGFETDLKKETALYVVDETIKNTRYPPGYEGVVLGSTLGFYLAVVRFGGKLHRLHVVSEWKVNCDRRTEVAQL
jgi:hypothetical protein